MQGRRVNLLLTGAGAVILAACQHNPCRDVLPAELRRDVPVWVESQTTESCQLAYGDPRGRIEIERDFRPRTYQRWSEELDAEYDRIEGGPDLGYRFGIAVRTEADADDAARETQIHELLFRDQQSPSGLDLSTTAQRHCMIIEDPSGATRVTSDPGLLDRADFAKIRRSLGTTSGSR